MFVGKQVRRQRRPCAFAVRRSEAKHIVARQHHVRVIAAQMSAVHMAWVTVF